MKNSAFLSLSGLVFLAFASGCVGFVAEAATLNAPSGLAASLNSSNAVQLQWKDNSIGDAGSAVYRSIGSSMSFTRISYVSGTSYTDSAVSASTTYYYKVQSYAKSKGKIYYSADSNIVSITIPGVSPSPSPSPSSSVSATAFTISSPASGSSFSSSFQVKGVVGSQWVKCRGL